MESSDRRLRDVSAEDAAPAPYERFSNDEIDALESRGISCAGRMVSSRAHLIFPWHQAHDAIAEAIEEQLAER